MKPDDLRIAVIDDSPVRAAILEEGLREAGHRLITRMRASPTLLRELSELDPDVIVIDLVNPSRDSLEQMFQISRHVPRPVAMFVDQSGPAHGGGGDRGGRLGLCRGRAEEGAGQAILDMSISRFRAFGRLEAGAGAGARGAEAARSSTRQGHPDGAARADRARGLRPPAARSAMNENRRIADVAQSVITAAELLP